MNPNDLLAQQQAMLNQLMQNNQHMWWGVLAIQIGLFILSAWVLYMFYARLRDIGEEIRNFRISYEFANSRDKNGTRSSSQPQSSAENPFGKSSSETKYMPKSQV